MRSMYWKLEMLGNISAFAYRHRETKKNQEILAEKYEQQIQNVFIHYLKRTETQKHFLVSFLLKFLFHVHLLFLYINFLIPNLNSVVECG